MLISEHASAISEHAHHVIEHASKMLSARSTMHSHKAKAYAHNFAKAKAGINEALKALHGQLKIGHDHDEKILKDLQSKSQDGISATHNTGAKKVEGYKHKNCPTMRAVKVAEVKHSAAKAALDAVGKGKVCSGKHPLGTEWFDMDVNKETPSFGAELRTAWEKMHAQYLVKAAAYAAAQKEHKAAKKTHEVSIASFKTALRIEADNTHSRCLATHGEYEALAKDVISNVGTRKAVYISTLVVRCYVDHLGNKEAAMKCAEKAKMADTSQWDIKKAPLQHCVSVDKLKNSMGPTNWTPTPAQCKFWRKVMSDIAEVAEAAAIAVETAEAAT